MHFGNRFPPLALLDQCRGSIVATIAVIFCGQPSLTQKSRAQPAMQHAASVDKTSSLEQQLLQYALRED